MNDHETQAVALAAERRLQIRLAKTDLPPVGDRAGWLKSARANIWTDHVAELHEMAGRGLHPKAMADRIQPPVTSPYPAAGEDREPAWDDVTDESGRLVAVPRRTG